MLEQKVIQAISKVKELPESEIRADSTFEALEVDSLDAIEILFEVEEEYDIKVPTENLTGLKTVQDVIDGVQALLDASPNSSADGQAPDSGEKHRDEAAGSTQAGA